MTSGGREMGAGAMKARPFLPYYSSQLFIHNGGMGRVLFGNLDQSMIDVL